MTDITRNVGAANAAASTTRFYLSLDTVRDAGDILLSGARGIGPLSPGQFSTDTVTVFIPTGTPAGTYYLLGCADDLGVVNETNESNNCVASARTTNVTLPTADLAVTAVSDPPVAAVPGGSFLVTDTTLNVGPVTVGATTTQYVLSVDAVRSANDVVIGSRGMGALGPGVFTTGSAVVTIPVGTATGTYFVLACADGTAQVVEASESNNCRASAGTVAVGPATADLVVTALNDPPATVAASASFTVTDTTQNAGTGGAPTSSTRYYLSSNAVRDAGDVLLDRRAGGPGARYRRDVQRQRDRHDSGNDGGGAVLPAGVCGRHGRDSGDEREQQLPRVGRDGAGDAGQRGPGRELGGRPLRQHAVGRELPRDGHHAQRGRRQRRRVHDALLPVARHGRRTRPTCC